MDGSGSLKKLEASLIPPSPADPHWVGGVGGEQNPLPMSLLA